MSTQGLFQQNSSWLSDQVFSQITDQVKAYKYYFKTSPELDGVAIMMHPATYNDVLGSGFNDKIFGMKVFKEHSMKQGEVYLVLTKGLPWQNPSASWGKKPDPESYHVKSLGKYYPGFGSGIAAKQEPLMEVLYDPEADTYEFMTDGKHTWNFTGAFLYSVFQEGAKMYPEDLSLQTWKLIKDAWKANNGTIKDAFKPLVTYDKIKDSYALYHDGAPWPIHYSGEHLKDVFGDACIKLVGSELPFDVWMKLKEFYLVNSGKKVQYVEPAFPEGITFVNGTMGEANGYQPKVYFDPLTDTYNLKDTNLKQWKITKEAITGPHTTEITQKGWEAVVTYHQATIQVAEAISLTNKIKAKGSSVVYNGFDTFILYEGKEVVYKFTKSYIQHKINVDHTSSKCTDAQWNYVLKAYEKQQVKAQANIEKAIMSDSNLKLKLVKDAVGQYQVCTCDTSPVDCKTHNPDPKVTMKDLQKAADDIFSQGGVVNESTSWQKLVKGDVGIANVSGSGFTTLIWGGPYDNDDSYDDEEEPF